MDCSSLLKGAILEKCTRLTHRDFHLIYRVFAAYLEHLHTLVVPLTVV